MVRLGRRVFLIGGAGVLVGAVLARPRERGGPYPEYFARLNSTLRGEGIAGPVLVVDLDRLERNVALVRRSVSVAPRKTYRIVVKSLPSLPLLEHVMRAADTRALMAFHLPFLSAIASARPDSDLLLGKPLPVDTARRFYRDLRGAFDPQRQLQWLVDTRERLAQYRELARGIGTRMQVSLEIDIGFHRGGFAPDASFVEALATIADDPAHLELAGFMGYEPHVGVLPGFLGDRAFRAAHARYEEFVELARRHQPGLFARPLTLDGAGSLTYRRYEGDTLLNDIAAGSCLVMPKHFDFPQLAEHEPAAFIATPVLKKLPGTRIAAIEWAEPLIRAWNPNRANSYFLYGGNWLADFEAPPGLEPIGVFTSSNQQGVNASDSVALAVDDFVFLRPRQSESVLLQFGDLLVVRGERIADRWPVLQNTGGRDSPPSPQSGKDPSRLSSRPWRRPARDDCVVG